LPGFVSPGQKWPWPATGQHGAYGLLRHPLRRPEQGSQTT
jgi:hypothetical protein